ncbi:MAG: PIN domain-containing protein [Clostridia bacterium]|nr:PIN domain-containing protein [Clostridia bacterium]
MKRLIKVLIALLGGLLFFGLSILVIRVLQSLGIVDLAAVLTPGQMSAVYIGLGVVGFLLNYLAANVIRHGVVAFVTAIESTLAQLPLQNVLGGIAGLMIGLILALLLSTFISRIPTNWVSVPLTLLVYLLLGYLGAALGSKRQDEISLFKKINTPADGEEPVAEPSRAERRKNERNIDRLLRGIPPKVLDTSVLIDGRVLDIARTGVLEGRLIVPSFVLGELQHIADSADPLRRQRGRRGLDIVAKMQEELKRVQIVEKGYEGLEVDEMLIELAKEMKGKLLTTDFNLNKVATVKGVEVININEMVNALKTTVLPGEEMVVPIVREGREPGQGIGYLPDGTMIVVDKGVEFIGEAVETVVTSVLQTNAGRMIFARLK